jgi:uncharacterized glyoxalase superfamily protein PhnB
MNQTHVATKQTIFPAALYVDPRAAIAWLERAFGASVHALYDAPDGSVAHSQIVLAGNIVMLGQRRDREMTLEEARARNVDSAGIYVVLPTSAEVDALHARAAAAGATIVRAPNDTDYGSHEFGVLDCEHQPWSFGTYDPFATDH